MITLTHEESGDKLTLNPHFIFEDEFSYSELAQQQSYSLTGALLVENSIKRAGRPITLTLKRSRNRLEGGATRKDVAALNEWVRRYHSEPLILTIHGRSYRVIFRAHDGLPVEAEEVKRYSNPDSTDYVALTVRLTEI